MNHRVTLETKDPRLVEQLVRQAESVSEPGIDHLKPEDQLVSPGLSRVYVAKTGEIRDIPSDMLTHNLMKMVDPDDPRSDFVFTTADPGFRPERGELKCWFHPDDPRREEFDRMGMPVCKKSGMFHEFQQTQHVQHKHRQEYKELDEAQVIAERQEDRMLQWELLRQASGGVLPGDEEFEEDIPQETVPQEEGIPQEAVPQEDVTGEDPVTRETV